MENLNIMNNEEIKNYNRLCAEFLGAKNLGKLGYSDLESYNCNWKGFNQNLKFHSDWNWIFEVVEAIEKLGYYTKNECIRNINYFNIYELENNEATFYGTDNSKKEAVINAINQFLIWYKTNNNAK